MPKRARHIERGNNTSYIGCRLLSDVHRAYVKERIMMYFIYIIMVCYEVIILLESTLFICNTNIN